MLSFSRVLTIAVIVLAIIALSAFAYATYLTSIYSYNSAIQYSFTKSPSSYDYSCDVNDTQIFFTIKNSGTKNIVGLSLSITNPLCVGSLPVEPSVFNASSSLNFFAQSTSVNGTLTLSGNNTYVPINF
jgi:hypothetical protein